MGYGYGGPTASKHDHVGFMVHEDRQCYCSDCGQKWWLKVDTDKGGKTITKWIPAREKQW